MRGRLIVAVIAALLVVPAQASALELIPPTSAATPPMYGTGAGFEIPYVAADDAGGSGLARVDLYAKAPGELVYSLAGSDTTFDTPSFSYTPTAGDGSYTFYTVAVDNGGNTELPPLIEDGTTIVDSTAPDSTAAGPSSADGSAPIQVTYSASDPAGSGVASVELWVQPPGAAGFSLAETDTTPDTPLFSYAASGAGTYGFYTVAVDAAGNREAPPSSADTQTVVTGPPGAGTTTTDTTTTSTETTPTSTTPTETTPTPTDTTPTPTNTTPTTTTPASTMPTSTTPTSTTSTTTTPTGTSTTATSSGQPAPQPSTPSDNVVAQLQSSQQPPPPATPAATEAPSIPLVAALSFIRQQNVRTIVARGIHLKLFAYKAVAISVRASLSPRDAKRYGLAGHRVIAAHLFKVDQPAVYELTLRLKARAAKRLRTAKALPLILETTLTGGSGSSTSATAIRLPR